jgi:soluble lytic murein transglycosylase
VRQPIFLFGSCLLLSSSAFAWDEAPVCPEPELVPMFPLLAVSDGASHGPSDVAMCSLDAPHVLRGPGYEDCVGCADRESEENAPLVASRALERARALALSGLYDDALLNLRVVEATMPRIADYVAVLRAELHISAGDPKRAVEAYKSALSTCKGLDLTARVQVGYVEALLRAQEPQGVKELDALLARYPALPEGPRLRFELAQYREREGKLKTALTGYRTLDLTLPAYPIAERARERMRALAAQGHAALPYTPTEQLERGERLFRSGPSEFTQSTLEELRTARFPKPLVARRDALLAAYDAKSTRRSAPEPSASASAAERKKLSLATTPLKLAKAKPFVLFGLLQSALRHDFADMADTLLLALAKRAAVVPADTRFDALVIAAGRASDESLLAVADTLVMHPSLGVAARYHRARCLERLKQGEAARIELARVVDIDRSVTRFYGNFANQRLRLLNGESLSCQAAGRRVDCNSVEIDGVLSHLEQRRKIDLDDIADELSAVAAEHGDAYPWLWRALDLVRLGELGAAGDELHEAYLAYRFVARRGPLNAGRIAIYRGRSVVQPPPDFATQRARLGLKPAARTALAQVAFALGDLGTAVEFGGNRYIENNPEPYADEVARVARKYSLDPDLLFAVMRVESVYHRRIISHAGAIGLMQIMPRTGRLIATQLGLSDTTATDLLDPKLNLELSGWYLSALLVRMDGRLPLAIASYNGGPHNVRRWIDEYGDQLPLDVFLERIPFAETKRYVRRVLGFYAQYKANRGHNVDLMTLTLPADNPEGVAF